MTVALRLKEKRDGLTRSEIQLVDTILEDYPMSGLGNMSELAHKANVSTPTVLRMVRKIGFKGFPDFQSQIRSELSSVISSPVSQRIAWHEDMPQQHIVSSYAQASLNNQMQTLEHLDLKSFDEACTQMADPNKKIYIAGGRITHTIAQYLYLHLQMMRAEVKLIPASTSWGHDLVDICEKDMLIVFDVRRYQNDTRLMAHMAASHGAKVMLLTDQWRSPIAKVADFCFSARTSAPSVWDSAQSMMLLVECMIAALQHSTWDNVQTRSDALEAIFDQTKLFRKFS